MRTLFPALALCALAVSGCAERAGLSSFEGREIQSANLVAQAASGFDSQRMVATQVRFRASTPDTVTFDFDSSRLDAEARRVLDLQAQWLQLNPSVRMRVTGHADAVGPDGYNSRIGLRRARAVVAYLGTKGVARTRLDAVESRGEEELVVETPERERRNRRTVTNVAGFERGFSGHGMNGRRARAAYKAYVGDNTESAGAPSLGG